MCTCHFFVHTVRQQSNPQQLRPVKMHRPCCWGCRLTLFSDLRIPSRPARQAEDRFVLVARCIGCGRFALLLESVDLATFASRATGSMPFCTSTGTRLSRCLKLLAWQKEHAGVHALQHHPSVQEQRVPKRKKAFQKAFSTAC